MRKFMEFGKPESDAERISRNLHAAKVTKGSFSGATVLRVQPKEACRRQTQLQLWWLCRSSFGKAGRPCGAGLVVAADLSLLDCTEFLHI